ncbi:MAG: DUF1559 domain-containing protein [Thermoguttaceae bacterium]
MKKRNAFTLLELCIVIAIIGTLFLLIFPNISPSRERQRCARCIAKMKQLGVALRNYHDKYGSFPPAYTVDENGEPLHSWRTLILPFLENYSLHRDIRLDEPCDSEYNQQFHQLKPYVFHCPNVPFASDDPTSIYKLVVGDGTAAGKSLSSFKRKPSEVVLLIEAWPPVSWMGPEDFSTQDFKTAIYPPELNKPNDGQSYYDFDKRNPQHKPVIGCYHPTEFHVLFADGTVKTYKKWKLPITELEKMCQIE